MDTKLSHILMIWNTITKKEINKKSTSTKIVSKIKATSSKRLKSKSQTK